MAQYIEVIEWHDPSGKELAYRRVPGGEIKLGAQLVVQESQWAVFFRDGKALDVFEPGRHTLSTNNVPILTKVLSLPFGGTSPFRADVVYVSRKVFEKLKWGTKEPVVFRDSELDMVRLRAFGNFTIRVADAQLFVNTLVGSQGYYDTDHIEGYLRDVIVSRLNDVLGETMKTILDLPRYYDEIGSALKMRTADDFGKYGIDLTDFFINAITPPEEVQKAMDERASVGALGNRMQGYMQMKAARAMEAAADNEGTAGAGMGMGMGAGFGMMMPGMVANAMQPGHGGQPQQGGQAPPVAMVPCPSCQNGVPQGSKFCPNCGNQMPQAAACSSCNTAMPAGAKFCPNCGTQAGAQASCPSCQTELQPGAKFCANCGHKM